MFIDLARFEERSAELASAFRSAAPFPHAVLRDVLSLDAGEVERFPAPDWPHWKRLTDHYQHQKAYCSDLSLIPPPWREVIQELSSAPFLRLLERVTGIPKLLPDPYLEGGGLHMSGPGGRLSPHTDFHVYEALDLYRRVNLLLYLNPGWAPEDGGQIALYGADPATPVATVLPTWGRCVIFATDDRSVHGVMPVAPERWRRSIALYYYTAEPSRHYSGDRSTHWQTHGELGGMRRLRALAYVALMRVSRLFSMLAHLVNPHYGLRTLREKASRSDR
jgi:hypothetical protein